MTVQSGTRLGPYEIQSPLGAGGMGEVYRARDTRLGREVAIKVLPEALSADIGRLRRFEKEAQAASALNHPNIITVYDIGSSGPTSYIAMELVEGVTLRQLLADGPMSLKKLIAIASQVAEGLAKAHGVGIVHRDLKPENVMVTRDGFAKILDFGLAKLTQPEDSSGGGTQAPTVSGGTEPGIVVGTVAYMSPEQALGKPVDFRSDQFSFGSMLYEMVAGRKAFTRASGPETMAAIIREEPEPLSSVAPATPVPLRWIVERCLAKDMEERYASTRDLARDLARLREGISEASSSEAFAATAAPLRTLRPRLLLTTLALLAGAAIGVLVTRRGPDPAADYHAVTFRRGTVGRARFAPDGQTIVYGAEWEGRPTELYSTRADSPEARTLIPNADVASISSSGKMAVTIFQDPARPTVAEMSLAGGAPREIVEGVWQADWTPDGQKLAVIRKNKLEFPVGKVFGAATEGMSLASIRFSPDGRQIAAVENLRSESEGASLVVFDVPSGKKRTVSSGWGFASPGLAWHPRTGEIWFSPRDVEPGSVLMVCAVDPSTGKSRVVARPPGIAVVQDIAPDGRVLMKVDDWHESVMYGQIGSTAETNLSWLDFSKVMDISDDGKMLLLDESGRGGGARGSIYIRKSDGSAATRLGDGRPLAMSPDGKWIIAVPGTTPDRLILLPTGAGESKVLRTEGLQYASAVWMPDGRRFLFTARAVEKPYRVYVQDVSGDVPRLFAPEGFGIGGPVSPDGKTAILNRSGVPPGAPGVNWFLFPVEGGGVPRPIPGLGEDVDDLLRWDATGRSVYLRKGWPRTEIWRLDIESRRQEKIGAIEPSDATGTDGLDTLYLTPDGKTYAYSIQRRLSTVYVVTGLR
jgi:eukaryotic-like serine/threonine-protein kinase